jgi:hypothetical protein
MNKIKCNKVKARSVSEMSKSNIKVDFEPTQVNKKRIALSNKVGHIRNVNNIVRFESIR